MMEVKKSKESKNLYLEIYDKFKEISYPSKIAREIGMTKQNLEYYLSFFKEEGIIECKGRAYWIVLKELTHDEILELLKEQSKKDSSLGTRPKTDLHAFQMKFPILSGELKDSDWEIKEHLNNWIPKYKRIGAFGGLALKNNNNKSITIWVKSKQLKNLDKINILAYDVRNYLFEYFLNKHNVVLDINNCEIKNINLATEDSISEGIISSKEKFEIDLNKKSEKIFPKDNLDAKAWIDGSPFKFSAETNDKAWKRAYLMMPFLILGLSNSLPALEEYNQNLKLHIEVQESQLRTQIELRDLIKQLAKLNKPLT